MSTFANSLPEDKTALSSQISDNKKEKTSTFHFSNNRSEALTQKTLQNLADTSSQVQKTHQLQATANSLPSKTIQLQTKIKHVPAEITWDGATGVVGKEMVAKLDPLDPVKGSAVDTNTQTDIDQKAARYNPGKYARGHLLNHDLGGYGIQENLFPITSGANSHHAQAIEYPIKKALIEAKKNQDLNTNPSKQSVYYEVVVKGTPSHSQFHCKWRYANNDFTNLGEEQTAIIDSKLNNSQSIEKKEDPYFSPRGRVRSDRMEDWWHSLRQGRLDDLDDEIGNGKIEMSAMEQSTTAIHQNDVPTDRHLTDDQKLQIMAENDRNKFIKLHEIYLQQIDEFAAQQAYERTSGTGVSTSSKKRLLLDSKLYQTLQIEILNNITSEFNKEYQKISKKLENDMEMSYNLAGGSLISFLNSLIMFEITQTQTILSHEDYSLKDKKSKKRKRN
jgi:hypothetical protein